MKKDSTLGFQSCFISKNLLVTKDLKRLNIKEINTGKIIYELSQINNSIVAENSKISIFSILGNTNAFLIKKRNTGLGYNFKSRQFNVSRFSDIDIDQLIKPLRTSSNFRLQIQLRREIMIIW